MEIKVKITLDMLTEDSVSVLKQQFINVNGVDMQIGENVRNAYTNDADGRAALEASVPAEYFNAVLTVWNSEA